MACLCSDTFLSVLWSLVITSCFAWYHYQLFHSQKLTPPTKTGNKGNCLTVLPLNDLKLESIHFFYTDFFCPLLIIISDLL